MNSLFPIDFTGASRAVTVPMGDLLAPSVTVDAVLQSILLQVSRDVQTWEHIEKTRALVMGFLGGLSQSGQSLTYTSGSIEISTSHARLFAGLADTKVAAAYIGAFRKAFGSHAKFAIDRDASDPRLYRFEVILPTRRPKSARSLFKKEQGAWEALQSSAPEVVGYAAITYRFKDDGAS